VGPNQETFVHKLPQHRWISKHCCHVCSIREFRVSGIGLETSYTA